MSVGAHQKLHGFFIPFMAYGHLIPTIDTARLFAVHDVKATIISTPLYASFLSKTIDRDVSSGLDIAIQVIQFPAAEVGLPEGMENVDSITSREMLTKFFMAINMLQEPIEQLLEEHRPDFIVADMFLPWTTEVAGKLGIPRFVFQSTNVFSRCVENSINHYRPFEGISSDREAFVVPGLPDKIEMTKSQLSIDLKERNEFSEWLDNIRDSELKSYGVLVNSFYKLEPAYVEHYKKVMGRRSWHIGPVSLRNRNTIDKAERGKKASIDEHYVLNWLNSKEPNSVLYVSFGSFLRLTSDQLLEIAMGLDDSGFSFIWVIRTKEQRERDLPEGFEERMEGKGLIIREWAPQVLILDHPAVGGFMTHCGWNSILEALSAGVPMITWPLSAEQFINEYFVTRVLKIGVQVGVEEWRYFLDTNREIVKGDKICKLVTQLMNDGEEAEGLRGRVKELSDMAKSSVEEGGSSSLELTTLIEELKMNRRKPLP